VNILHAAPLDLEGARIEGLTRLPFQEGLLEGTGVLESSILETDRLFDDLVGSWNAACPKGSSIELSAQVRQDGRWSGWYRLSRWSPGAGRSLGAQKDSHGRVDVDTLRLSRKADAFRYRVRLEAVAGNRRAPRLPKLRCVCFAALDSSAEPALGVSFEKGPWIRELALRPRSQMVEDPAVRKDICSPTALAMVLEYWGVRRTTAKVAEAVRDHESGIYGNWPLNVAAAAGHGLWGGVVRLPSILALQDEIAGGRPIIVSISFRKEELRGSPIPETKGHLVVVTGFTPGGDVITADPAAPGRAGVRRVYRRAEFEKSWLGGKHGLAYLLGRRFPAECVAGAAASNVFARRPGRANAAGLVSQVLYGERVRVLAVKGDWAKVSVPGQPYPLRRDDWSGYPGWVHASSLRAAPVPYVANAVVRAKRASLLWRDASGAEQSMTLPLGALLCAGAGNGSSRPARMLSGVNASIEPALTYALGHDGKSAGRRDILEAAALFIGDRYLWGGRLSLGELPDWGVDCSGLVQLAYQSAGIVLPRDAQHQFLKARPVRRRELQPADLIFLTPSPRSRDISHVMLYSGGDSILESRESAGKALRTTFIERFGAQLALIESGAVVTDLTRSRPFKRRVFFGSFLGES